MVETHPFGIFAPKSVKYLLLGSFTTKEANFDPSYDWFYGTSRNQFWKILRIVYNLPLDNKIAKQQLFTNLEMALGDIIYQCERRKGSNLDMNLVNIVYNTPKIEKLLTTSHIQKVYFSSRYVEKMFRTQMKEFLTKNTKLILVTLPSPSPRYAALRFEDKVKIYKALLPKLNKLH